MSSLLAVDLGVRAGLACYDESGRLRWYRSSDFGDAARLRRAIAWSGLRPPSSLDRDAADAILIGMWGVMNAGWVRTLPV